MLSPDKHRLSLITSQSHLSRLCSNTFNPKPQHIQMRLHHLGVWSYLSYEDTSTSIQTVAACFISLNCTFDWRHQPFPSHRGGNWRRQASPHSYWPPLRCTNIDDDVTHSSAGPVYIQDSTFAITLAADVLAPHSARSLIETRMTISPYTFHSYFNWQSMIMFNFNWPEKFTQKAVHIFRNLAGLIISVPVEPRQIHVSVNSNENDQLQS